VLTLEWLASARADLLAIVEYVADDNPNAAQRLKDNIQAKAANLLRHPKLYRPGRVKGTREMVVQTNYVVVYTENAFSVRILRVLHAARQWPPNNRQKTS